MKNKEKEDRESFSFSINNLNHRNNVLSGWLILLTIFTIGLLVLIVIFYQNSPKKVCTDNPYIVKLTPQSLLYAEEGDILAHSTHYHPSYDYPIRDNPQVVSYICTDDNTECLIKIHNVTCEIK